MILGVIICGSFGIQSAYAEVITTPEISCGTGEIGLSIEVAAINRAYNGLSFVDLNIQTYGIEDGDDVSVSGVGHMQDANVGTGKHVYFGYGDITINGADKDKYYIEPTQMEGYTSVDILPLSVSANWEITGTPFVYNGSSFISDVNVSFTDINSTKIPLKYSVKGYKRVNNNKVSLGTSDILLAGEYDLTIIDEIQNANYEITSATKTKTIYVSKAVPEMSLLASSFDYTGELHFMHDFVAIDNNEQELSITFDEFATSSHLEWYPPVVTALESDNYHARMWIYGEDFSLEMNKAHTEFDFTNFKTIYEYTGSSIPIDKTKISIGNSEQSIYLNMDSVSMVGTYNLLVSTNETNNYLAASTNITIEVTKKKIDVSNFVWKKFSSGGYFCTYDGSEKSVSLSTSSQYVLPYYSGEFRATNVGKYIAKVSFVPVNNELYEVVGETANLVWEIVKAKQNIPVLAGTNTFVYNGYTHTLVFSILENSNFYIEGNTATKAGEYQARIVLRDPNNFEWVDGTTNFKSQSWKIEKARLTTPFYGKNVLYTGKDVSVGVASNNLYYIVGGSAKDVGTHTTYLVLKDSENYSWADSSSPILSINWAIVGKENYQNVPVVTLVFVVLAMAFVAIGGTLRFTHIRKKRRARASASAQQTPATALTKTPTMTSTTTPKKTTTKKPKTTRQAKEKDANIKIQKTPLPKSLKTPSTIKKRISKTPKHK